MRISDEIRQWCDICCDDYIDADDCDELRDLAKRIDSEMVELPLDMDGVPIHIGDTAYLYNGFKAEVKSIEFNQGEQTVIFTVGYNGFYPPSAFTHTRPDSLVRIAEDIEERIGTGVIDGSTLCKWVERIRKLAKEEDK